MHDKQAIIEEDDLDASKAWTSFPARMGPRLTFKLETFSTRPIGTPRP